ncbi:MAG: Lrp/AsnC family transcriptional regulator [Promethearchaeota archaeon]|nr:MAG: Lrp/AsnC family transcriptional regulator [Candidatus Lokiarchaeota archaeon]
MTILNIMSNEKLRELESIDYDILRILSKDSRKSNRKLGEELEKSPTTIGKHIEELIERKILKEFTIMIDYEKLGYDIIALVELNISQGKMLEVENDIAKDPHIFGVYDVTGKYDALLLARFKTRTELSEMVKNINSKPYIENTNTHLILNVIKEGTNLAELMEK